MKPRNPGPRDPASSTHSTTLAKAEERPGRHRGAPGPSPALLELPRLRGGCAPTSCRRAAQRAPLPEAGLAEREVHGRRRVHKQRSPQPRAPSPSARRSPGVSAPPGRERDALGLGDRRTPRSAEPPPWPRRPSARPRAQCGLPFPAARASPGPGNKAGSARRRPPGRAADTHRELGRPPAGRARGCRARRGWAQGTGLGCFAAAAAAAGRKCGSETGREGRGAETAACAPPGPPPGMCVTSELG